MGDPDEMPLQCLANRIYRTLGLHVAVLPLLFVLWLKPDEAHRLEVSRSVLYATYVEAFVKQHRIQGVAARVNAVYSSESNSLDDEYYTRQQCSLDRDGRL